MTRRRTSVPPMRVQIAQIDHSQYPPRPVQDDAMSVATNQFEGAEDMVEEADEDMENCPEDFSPRLWQLFNRIQRRGTEPLFPADWQLDFLNMPPSLFHPPMPEYVTFRPIISSLETFRGSEFRLKQAFEKLTVLGQQVRNREQLNREKENMPPKQAKFLPVEPLIHAECEKFASWAAKDGNGGTSTFPPCRTEI
jgi:hypothetical protein